VTYFLLRRLGFGILALVAATAVVFGFSRTLGDPLLLYTQGYGMTQEHRDYMTKYLGLDKPLVVQYFHWLKNAARGDLGRTFTDRVPVAKRIGERLGASLQLSLAAILFAIVVGIPLGVLSAVRRGQVWDYGGRFFALFGQALPQFWVGVMAILIFAVTLGWLPSSGRGPVDQPFWSQIKYFILPAMTEGWIAAANFLRLTRSSMLEVLDSEYVKLARAKGVPEWQVIWKHAFKNALLAPLTMSSVMLAFFISGAVVVELVFAWPGLGRLMIQAVYNNDFPTMTGCILVFTALFVVLNFLVDLTYGIVDPRIRQQ
jgi:ABC-type dipeptide/oligopeptide/nickel transport system permease component